MMRKKFRTLALALALVMCAGLMTECGSSDDGSTSEDSSLSDTQETTDSETEEESQDTQTSLADTAAFTVAEVSQVAEDGTLTLILYEPTDSESTDSSDLTSYADLDLSQFQRSEETQTYTPQDSITVDEADNGTLTPASLQDIAVGDTLVIYTDEEGNDAIVLYPQQSMTAT